MKPGSTRRELMQDGAAAAAVAGALGLAGAAAAAAATAPVQARALTHALQIEQLVVIAYRQVVGSSVLTPSVAGQLQTHLTQELEHVGLLERALASRGELVPTPPALPAAQAALTRHGVHWSLTHLTSQHNCLKLLVDVESLAENAYFKAIQQLTDLALARICAEIMGCEAQHWTVLSGFLNHRDPMKAVPYPFVEGSP
jgi:Ferritin-like domain